MPYKHSYIWQLREKLGSRKLLVPAAAIVVEDRELKILLQLRADNRKWGFPGGAVEPNQDFATAAISELDEETGLTVMREDLIPFASLSQPQENTFFYPNGDITHYFSLCFLVQRWSGSLCPEPEECLDLKFFHINCLPKELSVGTEALIDLLIAYKNTGSFQLG